MRTRSPLITVFAIVLLYFIVLPSQPSTNLRAEVLHPWHNLWGNLYDSYAGYNSLYHIGAAVSTWGLVASGADDKTQRYFQTRNPIGDDFGRWGLFLGWWFQIAPAAGMYFWGLGSDDDDLASGGAAGIQAIAVTGAITMALKLVTGRKAPLKNGTDEFSSGAGFRRTDRADDFVFFNTNFSREEGRFFWPSGHTSSTITFVSAMYTYYPEKTWIAWVGYPVSLAMGLAMIEYDAHWLSDVTAGALIGHVIGYTIGKNFRNSRIAIPQKDARRFNPDEDWHLTFTIMPRQDQIASAAVVSF
ncbi:MAG: phosphatase PAP2 family protein [Leptospiraceae bacterium]|nr:phosphatase PAP2 family protein [Leptospiraceae bacterium]